MAVIVNGDGILTGVSSLTTALDDITSGRGTVTGVATVGTLQLGTGVSISSPRSQNVSIFTNDSEKLTVDDAGRVGIGTDNPDTLLHVRSSSGTAKLITLNGGNTLRNNYIGLDAADNLEIGADEDNEGSSSSIRFRIDGSEVVRFHNAGRIGVNTASPLAELHLVADNPNIEFNDTNTSNNGEITLDNAALRIEVDEDNSTASSKIDFRVDGSDKFNIDSSGNFNVAGSVGRFDSTGLIKTANGSASTPSHTFINDPDNGMYRETTNTIALATAGTERLRIASDGHVAIGGYGDPASILDIREEQDGAETKIRLFNTDNDDTTTQTAALYLSPDSRATALAGLRVIKENADMSTTAGRDVSLTLNSLQNNSQVEAIRIDSNGRVLIGADTVGSADGYTNNFMVAEVGGSCGMSIQSYNSNSSYSTIALGDRTVHNRGYIEQRCGDNNQMTIGLSGNGSIRFIGKNTSSGNVVERARITSDGLCFHGDTTSSRALDDYEEGNLTWLITKTTHPTQGSTNGSSVKYVKVGRLVHISGLIRTDGNNNDGSGYFRFQDGSSLPFTPETSGTSVIGHWRSQDSQSGDLTGSIAWSAGSTTLYIYSPVVRSHYAAVSNNVHVSSQTNLVITFSLTYRANS